MLHLSLPKPHPAFMFCVCLGALAFSGKLGAADKNLLDVLLQNGAINQTQYDNLLKTDNTPAAAGLLEILQQNGAISKEQYQRLNQQPAAQTAAAQPLPQTEQRSNSGDNIIHKYGGVTEGGAPEPNRVGKEILPGVEATLGGFADSSAIYRSKNETADIASSFNTGIPFNNSVNAHQSEFRETARSSRISILMKGNVNPQTNLSGYLEMDFHGVTSANSIETNGYSPRLRLGYGTADLNDSGWHFLFGQNWSLLTTNKLGIKAATENLPLTIDGSYVPGFGWTRNPQLRLVKDFANRSVWFGISAESPQVNFGGITPPTASASGAAVTANNAGILALTGNYSTDVAPDVIAKLAVDPGWGHYELFGITRFFHDAITSNGGTHINNHTVESLAGGAAALLPVIPKVLDLQLSFMGGSGIGRYNSGLLPDVAFATGGAMTPLTEYTGLLGLVAHPSPLLDLYAYLGGERVDRYNQNVAAANTASPFGYGNSNLNNSGCYTVGGVCGAQTASLWQAATGFWATLYRGAAGTMKTGLQYSYTRRNAFSGQGLAPYTDDDMMMLAFRYYPLQK